MPAAPRLSIGLPVFNGELFLRQALDSLLNQTYRDFELIIVDNASTDATGSLCEEYAARDPRVRYVRQPENVGAAENFNTAFRLGRGELFKWAAHDDTLAPDFLERCIAVLDEQPDVVLAYSRVAQIDSHGEVIGAYDYPMRVDSPDPLVRFHDLVLTNHFCVAGFGVIRRAGPGKTPLIAKYVGSDRVLLAELALHGRLVEIPEYLFFRRDHPETSGRKFSMYRRLAWFDPKQKGKVYYPYWRVGVEFFKTAGRAAGSFERRLGAYQIVARWFFRRRWALLEDLKAASVTLFPFLKSLVPSRRGRISAQ